MEAASLVQSFSLWAAVTGWFTPMVFFVLLNVVIGTIAVTSKSHGHGGAGGGGGKPGAHHDQHHHHQYANGADHQQYHEATPVRQLSRTGSMLQRLRSFNLSFHMHRHRPEDYGMVAAPVAAVAEPAAAHAGAVERVEAVPRGPQQQQPAPKAAAQKPAKTATPQPRRRRDPSPPPPREPAAQEHHLPAAPGAGDSGSEAADFETLEEAFLAASGGAHAAHLDRIQSDTLPTAGEMPRKLAATMKKSASTKSAFAHFEPRDLPRRPATTREDRRQHHLDPADEDASDDFEDAVAAAADPPAPHAEVDARADDFINRFRQQLKLQRLESLMRYRDMLNRGR